MKDATKSTILDLVRTIELPIIPHDIALDGAGNLYVVEFAAAAGNHRIHKFDQSGKVLTAWGSQGNGPGQFSFNPSEGILYGGFVTVDERETVYVSDTYNQRVQKFDTSGAFLGLWESRDAQGAPFNGPGPISADRQGHIYVADFSGLQQFNLDGNYLRSFAAAGEAGVDSRGNLYAPLAIQNLVKRFDAEGALRKIWGSEGSQDGEFDFPLFLVVDPRDDLYVSDHSGRIQKFNDDGEFLGVWNDPGNGDGPFTSTTAITLDGEGNLYAAASDRSKIYHLRVS